MRSSRRCAGTQLEKGLLQNDVQARRSKTVAGPCMVNDIQEDLMSLTFEREHRMTLQQLEDQPNVVAATNEQEVETAERVDSYVEESSDKEPTPELHISTAETSIEHDKDIQPVSFLLQDHSPESALPIQEPETSSPKKNFWQQSLTMPSTTPIHKSLKDIIYRTNKTLYNVDSHEVRYKAGLRRTTNLPSLHPKR